ncbi:glycosyltransferase family 4 protein [bacterium]|nr:glycosyltransferase family 4 protein [bacterium]MCI0602885.1 glycosyltransferase family 4 protein [bacterium]
MKICFLSADRGITFSKHNGATAHVRSLATTFAKLGHEVTVVTPSEGGSDLGLPIIRIPTPQILDVLLTNTVRYGSAADPKSAEQTGKRMIHALGHVWNNVEVECTLSELFSGNQFDFLFEVYSPFGIAGGIIAGKFGVPHILNVHAPLAWEGIHYRKQALAEAAVATEEIAFQYAQLIITNSREMRSDLIGAGVPAEKIRVVPNGVDTELFAPEGVTYRDSLSGKVTLGFVGSLKAWHGIEVMIEAFRQLVPDPRIHLLVVGDGPLLKTLQKLSKEFPGRITLTGAVPMVEVPSYVRAMDITLAPYPPLERFYFSPLKILEYMAAGKAVVASNIGQIHEMIRDGEDGLLVPAGDATALAETIRSLVKDREMRNLLGWKARRSACRQHTWLQRAGEVITLAQTIHRP